MEKLMMDVGGETKRQVLTLPALNILCWKYRPDKYRQPAFPGVLRATTCVSPPMLTVLLSIPQLSQSVRLPLGLSA